MRTNVQSIDVMASKREAAEGRPPVYAVVGGGIAGVSCAEEVSRVIACTADNELMHVCTNTHEHFNTCTCAVEIMC